MANRFVGRTTTQNTLASERVLVSDANHIAGSTARYVRNPSWPTLPTVTASEQKLVALVSVWPGASGSDPGPNNLSVQLSGAYTVDFGDGSAVVNTGSGITTRHDYDYNNASLNNTNAPVTLTDAGDVITRSNHGYTNGMAVQFYNIVSTTGLTEGANYYVINATTNTFQVSTSFVDSTPVSLTTDGTATLLPYKIALVTITPQASVSITSISFIDILGTYAVSEGSFGSPRNSWNTGWLDVRFSFPNLTNITAYYNFGGGDIRGGQYLGNMESLHILTSGSASLYNAFFNSRKLRSVIIEQTTTLDISGIFSNCPALISVVILNTPATTLSQAFANCDSLQYVYFGWNGTAVGQSFASLFANCQSLVEVYVSITGTGTVTNTSSMFSRCYSLRTVSLFNTASVTNMSNMFEYCNVLRTVPLFNTASVTNMISMFQYCYSLRTVPLFNTASVTDMTYMFRYCYSLQSVPLFNTASVIVMTYMFYNCYSLQNVPLFNTASVTDMTYMFYNCYSLQNVPLFNTASVTDMTYMFNSCYSLRTIPAFNLAVCTSHTSMFNNCYSLQELPAISSPAIYVTNMFSNCYALQYVPITFTAAVMYSTASMFYNCYSLRAAPMINLATTPVGAGAVADTSNMFSGCYSLQSVPVLNTSTVINMSNMFFNCYNLKKIQISMASCTTTSSMFAGCSSLTDLYVTATAPTITLVSSFWTSYLNNSIRRIRFTGLTVATGSVLNLSTGLLSSTALNEFYTSLGSITPGYGTITVTGNYGITADNPAIATGKGWTVVGS
jgi:surface protein